MKALLMIIPLVLWASTSYGQLRSGDFNYPPTQVPDSTLNVLTFMPADFQSFLSESKATHQPGTPNSKNKSLVVTGWLLKHLVLKNTFDDFDSYPPVTMADFDTRTVSEYVGLYRTYSPYFNQ